MIAPPPPLPLGGDRLDKRGEIARGVGSFAELARLPVMACSPQDSRPIQGGMAGQGMAERRRGVHRGAVHLTPPPRFV